MKLLRGFRIHLIFIIAIIVILAMLSRANVQANSFLRNDNVTQVTLKIIPCEKEEQEDHKIRCKKKNENNLSKTGSPVLLSASDNEPTIYDALVEYIHQLFK